MCAPSVCKPGGIQCSPSYSESSDYSIACVFGKITPCVCVCVCVCVSNLGNVWNERSTL